MNNTENTQDIESRYYTNAYYFNKYLRRSQKIEDIKIPSDTIDNINRVFKSISKYLEQNYNKNMFHIVTFNYIIFKYFELHHDYHYMRLFPLLKSDNDIKIMDNIWEGICLAIDIPFIKSPYNIESDDSDVLLNR